MEEYCKGIPGKLSLKFVSVFSIQYSTLNVCLANGMDSDLLLKNGKNRMNILGYKYFLSFPLKHIHYFHAPLSKRDGLSAEY